MIVAGFGFRKGATPESFCAALGKAGVKATHAATLDSKANASDFQNFARSAGLPVLALPQSALAQMETPTQSDASIKTYGIGSIAEAAALVAAGPNAALIVPRVISADGMVTCAVAKGA